MNCKWYLLLSEKIKNILFRIMANTNNNSARQTHVSPGIYTKEVDLSYASKSLGITTLGVAGETVKGPAFQPILIENF